MPELVLDCIGASADRYAATPTMTFRLRVGETTGERVHAIVLRCRLRIEPQKRRYTEAEAVRLSGLFGERGRWTDTLHPLQWADAVVLVPGFTGSVEVDVVVPCTYDLEVAGTVYCHALDDGEIPVALLFSGTVFTRGMTGFEIAQVPWDREAAYRLPVAEWRQMMDRFFPNSGWLRLSRDTLDALGAYRGARALPTWEQTIAALLADAGVTARA